MCINCASFRSYYLILPAPRAVDVIKRSKALKLIEHVLKLKGNTVNVANDELFVGRELLISPMVNVRRRVSFHVCDHKAHNGVQSVNRFGKIIEFLQKFPVKKLLSAQKLRAAKQFSEFRKGIRVVGIEDLAHCIEHSIQVQIIDFIFFEIDIPKPFRDFFKFQEVRVHGPFDNQTVLSDRQFTYLNVPFFRFVITKLHLMNRDVSSENSKDTCNQCLKIKDEIAPSISAGLPFDLSRWAKNDRRKDCGHENDQNEPNHSVLFRHVAGFSGRYFSAISNTGTSIRQEVLR